MNYWCCESVGYCCKMYIELEDCQCTFRRLSHTADNMSFHSGNNRRWSICIHSQKYTLLLRYNQHIENQRSSKLLKIVSKFNERRESSVLRNNDLDKYNLGNIRNK